MPDTLSRLDQCPGQMKRGLVKRQASVAFAAIVPQRGTRKRTDVVRTRTHRLLGAALSGTLALTGCTHIGPKTVAAYAAVIATAKTIFWNGPMGIFEIDEFAKGTIGVAKAVAASGAISIVGGGDSIAAVKKAGVKDRISHISTGGGASLEYVAYETLPGITALEK